MRKIYMQSLNTFVIEKRNLSELVVEMANYTNRAIMKKIEAIRTLVTITEQSYRRFAETDEKTRNATAQYMLVCFFLLLKIIDRIKMIFFVFSIMVISVRKMLLM